MTGCAAWGKIDSTSSDKVKGTYKFKKAQHGDKNFHYNCEEVVLTEPFGHDLDVTQRDAA